LEDTLRDQDLFLEEIPFVVQYNKRDLKKETVPVSVLNEILNPERRPAFETTASKGINVVEPLETITKVILQDLPYEE
jgi:signal recognition particle receptor subunit beta